MRTTPEAHQLRRGGALLLIVDFNAKVSFLWTGSAYLYMEHGLRARKVKAATWRVFLSLSISVMLCTRIFIYGSPGEGKGNGKKHCERVLLNRKTCSGILPREDPSLLHLGRTMSNI